MKGAKNAIAIGLWIFASLAWGNGARYSQTTGKERTEMVVTFTMAENGETMTIESLDEQRHERYRIVADHDGNGRSMDFDLPTKGPVTLTREGNTVRSSDGTAIAVEGAPWYPSIEYGIARLLASGSTKGEFWVIDPQGLKAHKMVAETHGTETLSLGGKKVRSIAVRVTVVGVPSVFFSMDYWYGENDYTFLRFKGVRGFGTPVMTVEFETEVR